MTDPKHRITARLTAEETSAFLREAANRKANEGRPFTSKRVHVMTMERSQTSMLQRLRRDGHQVDFSIRPPPLAMESGKVLPAMMLAGYSTVEMMRAAEGKPCPYCSHVMKTGLGRKPTRDHMHPRSKGGTLARGNCVIVCAPCNHKKGSLTLEEFAAELEKNNDRRAKIVKAFMSTVNLGECDAK